MTSRDDWLTEGLAVLAADGEPGIRVDKLARRLGVTKGSFHHHFRGMADYRRALLERYESEQLAAHQRLAGLMADVPAETALRGLPARGVELLDTDLERAIRAWGVTDPNAREVQERVDASRLSFLRSAWFEVLGDEIRARSAALVPHLIAVGAGVVRPRLDAEELRSVFDLLGTLVAAVTDKTSRPEGAPARRRP